MKGHLYRKAQPSGWWVAYTADGFGFHKTEIPLDPADADRMQFIGQLPEGQHIMDGAEVHFKIEDYWETGLEEPVKVAKLIPTRLDENGYPLIDGTLALCDEKINEDRWSEIEEEYSTEQWPPFGGPFTGALTPWEWLKKNYRAPVRVNP